jgi:hypothetical protein
LRDAFYAPHKVADQDVAEAALFFASFESNALPANR